MKSTLLQKTFLGIFFLFFSAQGLQAHWFFEKTEGYWEKLTYNFKQHSSEIPVRIFEQLAVMGIMAGVTYGSAYLLNKWQKNQPQTNIAFEGKEASDLRNDDQIVFKMDVPFEFDIIRKSFRSKDAKPPIGIVLHGAPGVGKTEMAKTFAQELNAIVISADPTLFQDEYWGTGPKSIRALLEEAKRKYDSQQNVSFREKLLRFWQKGNYISTQRPVAVIIDEFDSMGSRIQGQKHGSHVINGMLNKMLSSIDTLLKDYKGKVVFITTTNFPDNLDPALTRDGRFKLVKVDGMSPDNVGRALKEYSEQEKKQGQITRSISCENILSQQVLHDKFKTPASIVDFFDQMRNLANYRDSRDSNGKLLVRRNDAIEALKLKKIDTNDLLD